MVLPLWRMEAKCPRSNAMAQTNRAKRRKSCHEGKQMREIDTDTWIMLGITWFHGLLCGYAIWRQDKRKPLEDE